MSIESLITIGIGVLAALYIGSLIRKSARSLLGTSRGAQGGCGGCSGCGTPDGHAETEAQCSQKDSLVVLKKHS